MLCDSCKLLQSNNMISHVISVGNKMILIQGISRLSETPDKIIGGGGKSG